MERESVDKIEVNICKGGQLNLVLDNGQIHATVNNNESNDVKSNIHSRTTEYLNKWNSNMFLNDFNKRDENAGVNISLKELYLEKHLPHYLWKNNKNKFDDLKNLLSEYIDKNYDKEINNKMLFILGQPGIGKTTLITWIAANIIDNINDILVYQFASDLKNIDWQNSSDKYDIADEILKELNLSYDNLEEKILIIDGFDEIIVGYDRAKIINDIYHKWIKGNSINKFSLIITCREHYVYNLQKVDCDYITLQAFNEEQIKSFCSIYQEKNNSNISKDTIENIIKNKDILGIPLILYMILALNISIEKEDSLVTVYNQIFSIKDGGIYNRCLQNKRYEVPHRISEIKEQIHLISQKIAFWMFENNSEYIPQKEYQEICSSVMQGNQQKNQDILIGNFFKSIKHCEGVESERLSFVHRSIYEYFVAEYIFEQINTNIKETKEGLAGIFGELLKKSGLSNEIFIFLKFKIRNCELKNMSNIINSIFQLMLQDGMTFYCKEKYKPIIKCELRIFRNMLHILKIWYNSEDNMLDIRMKEEFTSYLNLEKESIKLEFIDFSYVKFVNMSLKNVIFNNVNIKQSEFINVDLREAYINNTNLREAKFEDVNLREAKFENTNLSEAFFLNADLMSTQFLNSVLNKAIIKKTNLQDTKFINVKLKSTTFLYCYLYNVDFNASDLRNIRFYLYKNSYSFPIFFHNAILDIYSFWLAEKKFGKMLEHCLIELEDGILSYKEYNNLRNQKFFEMKDEILHIIKEGRNYLDY